MHNSESDDFDRPSQVFDGNARDGSHADVVFGHQEACPMSVGSVLWRVPLLGFAERKTERSPPFFEEAPYFDTDPFVTSARKGSGVHRRPLQEICRLSL